MKPTAIDRPSNQALLWLGLVLFTTIYYFVYDRLYLAREVQLYETWLSSLKAWAIWLLLMPWILRHTPSWRTDRQASASQLKAVLLGLSLGLVVSTAYQAWVFSGQANLGAILLFCYLPANLKIIALIMALKLLGPVCQPSATLCCQNHRNQNIELNIDAITHCTADGNYLQLHTAEQQYTTRSTLSAMAKRLQAHGFIQIHRRHLVNVTHIQQRSRGKVTLHQGTELPIGRVFQGQLP